jgi:hypothetical protein
MVGKVSPVQVYGGQSITSTGLWWAKYHLYRFMVAKVSPVQVYGEQSITSTGL